MPPQTLNRYVKNTPPPPPLVWQLTSRIERIASGRLLRLEFMEQAQVHWSTDNWTTIADSATVATGLGLHVFDVPTERLAAESIVRFTIFWPRQNRWEGADFEVAIVKAA
jgi:glucoamylase